MSTMAIMDADASDGATFAEIGSETTDMPASNLQKQQPTTVWRATDLNNAYLEIDFGSKTDIDFVGLLYTNGDSGATWQIRGDDDQSGLTSSSVAVDTGSISLWPTTGLGDWGRVHALHLFSSTKSRRWWRIDVTDTDNADNYFQAGRLVMGTAFRPGNNVDFGWGIRWRDGNRRAMSRDGHIFPKPRSTRRTLEFTLSSQSESDAWETLSDLFRNRGTSKDILVWIDPGNSARAQDWAVYGILGEIRPITVSEASLYETRITLEEMI